MNAGPSNPSVTPAAFPQTRWSLVREAGGEQGQAALAELCVRYWYPVYSYMRRCGHGPASAQHLSAAFFQRLSGQPVDHSGVSRFRDYVRDALVAFLAERDPGQSGDQATPPAGAPRTETLEQRLQSSATVLSPLAAFENSYALELIAHGLERLRAEAAQAGRLSLFVTLEAWLTCDPVAGEYEILTQRTGLRPLTLAMALKRLRSRFRELIDEELAQTVGDAQALESERAALRAALGGSA